MRNSGYPAIAEGIWLKEQKLGEIFPGQGGPQNGFLPHRPSLGYN